MQPLEDFNPALENLPSSLSPLEFIGVMTICLIVGVLFQWIISDDDDYRKYY